MSRVDTDSLDKFRFSFVARVVKRGELHANDKWLLFSFRGRTNKLRSLKLDAATVRQYFFLCNFR